MPAAQEDIGLDAWAGALAIVSSWAPCNPDALYSIWPRAANMLSRVLTQSCLS